MTANLIRLAGLLAALAVAEAGPIVQAFMACALVALALIPE